jgi:hypothetical protein
LSTDTVGPNGEELPPRSFPLEDLLLNKAKSQRVFTLEFLDASATVAKPPSSSADTADDQRFQFQAQRSQEDAQRAKQIRKGKKMTDKKT